MKNILFTCLLCLLTPYAKAQFGISTVEVSINGKKLAYPFAGGLACPQFSEADFNKDGKKDLFIFDRVGNKPLTFLNKGIPNNIDYEYAPQFEANFPLLNQWALLKDYNGDGAADIFAYLDNGFIDGVMVYQGFYDNNTLKFRRVNFYGYVANVILWKQTPTDPFLNLYVSGQDIPDLNDVDGDGDLDILTFANGGGQLDYYKNVSVENGWGKDSLRFELADNCWGKFYESGLSKPVTLSQQPGVCAKPFAPPSTDRNNLHAGSTVLSYDADNDGDMEVLLGDVSFNNINLLINGGNKISAFVTSQENNFPAMSGQPIELEVFPAPFMQDFNNDGKKDLVVAPNVSNSSEDQNTGWYYENTGTKQVPIFTFKKKNLISDGMIDLGSYTYPTIGDVTGDGLEDLVVGVGNRFTKPLESETRLVLFKNVGTQGNPKFELLDDNWLNFQQFSSNTFYLTPTLGDLDSDGDLDLLVGNYQGTLFYVENKGSISSPNFNKITINFQGIDITPNSAPCIFDFNNDGLNDILLGEKNGTFIYFQNKGTKGNPSFEPNAKNSPNITKFGNITTFEFPYTTGYSTTNVIRKGNNFIIVSGSELGKVYQFEGSFSDLKGTFTAVNAIPNLEDNDGIYTAIALSTFNEQTDYFKAITGNQRGGLSYRLINLKGNGKLVNSQEKFVQDMDFEIFPNPTQNQVTIDIKNTNIRHKLLVFNELGQQILALDNIEAHQTIDVNQLPKGVYFFKLFNEITQHTQVKKIVLF
jgi:hypothetical protein